jgi:hypothetical protein
MIRSDDPIKRFVSDILRTATVLKIKRQALEAAEKVRFSVPSNEGTEKRAKSFPLATPQPVKIIIRANPRARQIARQIARQVMIMRSMN